MQTKKYSSDLSAKGWQNIEKLLIVQRKSKHCLRSIINGILYVEKNGCTWRNLPACYPPWATVYWYFRKWIKDGTWDRISAILVVLHREKNFKKVLPSVAIIDSQSVKNSSTCTQEVGFDAGKKIKGRKRFLLVDTLGNVLDCFVTAASCHDGMTALKHWLWMSLKNELLQDIEKVFADGTFGGSFAQGMQESYNIIVEIPKEPIAQKGAVSIHAKRWIVERNFAWLNDSRRCAKDYERTTASAKAFIIIANIKRLLKKI